MSGLPSSPVTSSLILSLMDCSTSASFDCMSAAIPASSRSGRTSSPAAATPFADSASSIPGSGLSPVPSSTSTDSTGSAWSPAICPPSLCRRLTSLVSRTYSAPNTPAKVSEMIVMTSSNMIMICNVLIRFVCIFSSNTRIPTIPSIIYILILYILSITVYTICGQYARKACVGFFWYRQARSSLSNSLANPLGLWYHKLTFVLYLFIPHRRHG